MSARAVSLWLCGLLFVCGVAANFSGAAEPLPPGPLVAAIENTAAWEIAFQYRDDEAKEGQPAGKSSLHQRDPKKIELIRTRPLWHAIVVEGSGSTREFWSNGMLIYAPLPDGAQPMILSINRDNLDPRVQARVLAALGAGKFPDFEWLTPESYQGMEKKAGRTCLIFRNDDKEAWIDAESRAPVLWRQAAEVRTFIQKPAPAAMLSLPAGLSSILQKLKIDVERLEKKPRNGG